MSLAEYESQLADVQQLLEASPEDESLLALQKDLEELISITRQQVEGDDGKETTTNNEESTADQPSQDASQSEEVSLSEGRQKSLVSAAAAEALIPDFDEPQKPTTATTETDTEKKKKKMKDFVVPPHLVVRDTDSDADKNRKKRALKALKSKHRAEKRDYEANKKQQSWQSFQKKKKIKGGSMFSTSDDATGKVGVVSSKTGGKQRF